MEISLVSENKTMEKNKKKKLIGVFDNMQHSQLLASENHNMGQHH